MNKPKIAYFVSCHFSYAPFTLPVLLPSLKECGIPPEDIFVVMCGCVREFDVVSTQGNFWYVNHESRNFCTFVEASSEKREHQLSGYTHMWALMDTCKAGPKFHLITKDFDVNIDAIGAKAFINNGCQTDLGAYKLEYLRRKRDEGLMAAYRNCEPLANLVWEGRTFAEATIKEFYGGFPGGLVVLDNHIPKDVYGTGTPRITEYYNTIDLFKYKSNWGQFGHNLSDRC